ncbi:MAG: DUF1638 domain-containing protein [Acidimicrobiia bacterium]
MARPEDANPAVLVIGCGAIARELLEIVSRNHLTNIRVECLPAILHNTPDRIPAAVRARLETADDNDTIFVAYGDCGTGGRLDAVLDEFGVARLPGAHCYQFFAGGDDWARMHEAEPGTLYLTDFLARHFDRIVWQGLGLDRWPNLRDDYFGHYERVVFLAQTDDAGLDRQARDAARRLGLAYERHHVGYGELEPALVSIGDSG